MASDVEIAHTSSVPEPEKQRSHKIRRARKAPSNQKPNGRRGPGIFRPTINEPSALEIKTTKPYHFKPSLTPGLGTIRVVSNHMGVDTRVRFSMEPRAGDEAFNEWREAMRRMARLGDGLPKFVRRRVWSALADRQLTTQHVDWDHVVRLAFNNQQPNPDDDSLGSQIVKDLHRTGCDQFGSDEDRAALKRVLLAYARWNKRVGYCQGFNMIAAAILDVMDRDEQEAFKVMVYLIDYVLPESYFAQNLQALSVDIAVFRHLLQARLPRLAHHLDALQFKAAAQASVGLGNRAISTTELGQLRQSAGYEPPLMNVFIIQWFLTLFATCLAPDAVLRIWDSIMLEGSEVILRTAVVMMEFLSSRLLRVKSADQFYATMTGLMNDFAEGRIVSSQELLFEIYELAPFPYPHVKELREKFMYNIAPLVPENTSSLLQASNATNSTAAAAATAGPFRLLNRWKSARAQHMVVLSNNGPDKRRKSTQLDGKLTQAVKPAKGQTDFAASESKVLGQLSVENPTQKDHEKSECAEDEYQEVSLSPPVESGKQVQPVPEPVSVETKLPGTQQQQQHHHQPASTKSEPCSDSDEDWIGSKVRSTSCFAHMWPHRLRPIEPMIKSRDSMNGSVQLESVSLRNLSLGRSNSMSGEQRKFDQNAGAEQPGSDISNLGPGAVGETGTMRPESRTPLAHQARMSTNLTELKSVYRKQLARQRETTLRLPGLWQAESAKVAEPVSCFNNACMTAVLPQNRESKQMTFENSLDASAIRQTSQPVSPATACITMSLNADDNVDDVFLQSDKTGGPCALNSSTSDPETVSGTICRGHHAFIPMDPDLVGAVQSWRAKAVWTCKPMPPDSCGSESDAERAIRSNTAPVPESTEPRRRLTLRELAARLNEREASLAEKSERETRKSEDVESDSSLAYESAKSYPISTDCSGTQSLHTSPNKAATGPYVLGEVSPEQVLGLDSNAELTQADGNSTDLETASFYTSVSKVGMRRAPWAAATASFVSRRAPSQVPVTKSLPLPLSPKRRSFGAQFGMYKSVQTTGNARVWSNFCERVQTIGLQHRILTR